MKQEFSTAWKSSKQPRKQRKYLAKAPLHLRKKLVSINLSKDLRTKYKKRNIPVKKGDVVKIMRGKFRKKQGKVTSINLKKLIINVEGIQIKKQDGSKINVNLKPSNLQIVELEARKKIKVVKNDEPKNIKKELKGKNPKEKKEKA